MSIAPACVRVYVCTYVRVVRRQMSGSECGVRCLRASTVSSENDRENEASTNEKEGYSAGERTTGSTEDGERLWRTSTKGQECLVRRGSGEAIITKKRFVPEAEKFFVVHVAMNMKVA